MIKKIVFFFIFILLAISIPLALLGIERVSLSNEVLAFLKNCNRELQDFKVEIPTIPSIPTINVGFVDAFINFINGFVVLINFVITFVNILIQVLQYLFVIVKNLGTLKDSVIPAP